MKKYKITNSGLYGKYKNENFYGKLYCHCRVLARLLERLSSRSKARRPEGGDENGLAAALLLRHASIQICSFLN
jgi:hypothetical protein